MPRRVGNRMREWSVGCPRFQAIAIRGWLDGLSEGGARGSREVALGVGGDGGRPALYAHVSSPNGSMLEIARPAGEYEVSRLRFRQGLRGSPRPFYRIFHWQGKPVRLLSRLASLPPFPRPRVAQHSLSNPRVLLVLLSGCEEPS